ncbi:MAG: hypothetical protein REI11_10010 [Patulibacter sp.]|nr:hypothetical protein [Patulibacter sp.]
MTLKMPRSPWTTPRLPPLVGVTTACEMVGCHRKQLARWCEPGSGSHGELATYAPAWVEVDGRRLWTRDDVETFAEQVALDRAMRSRRS